MTPTTTIPAPPQQLEAWVSFLRAHAAITDLAERVLLTASGITRLLEGLERAGYVCKQTCSSDARVSYAQLTDAGATKLSEAARTHLRGIDELFIGRYSGSELATLAELLSRLPTTGSACKSAAPCS